MIRVLKSIRHALRGLYGIAKAEGNFRLELFAAVVVIALIIYFPLATWESVLLLVMTSSVLVLEVLNTAFERISDALKPRLHPMVKEVKDLMAGAVLLTALTAVVVGVLILQGYLLDWLGF